MDLRSPRQVCLRYMITSHGNVSGVLRIFVPSATYAADLFHRSFCFYRASREHVERSKWGCRTMSISPTRWPGVRERQAVSDADPLERSVAFQRRTGGHSIY